MYQVGCLVQGVTSDSKGPRKQQVLSTMPGDLPCPPEAGTVGDQGCQMLGCKEKKLWMQTQCAHWGLVH